MGLKKYETVIALRTDITEDVIEKFHSKLTGVLTRKNGHEIKFEIWGKRKLAYEIKLNTKTILIYYLYLGEPNITDEIEQNLRHEDLVLRFFTKKLADNVDLNSYDVNKDTGDKSSSGEK